MDKKHWAVLLALLVLFLWFLFGCVQTIPFVVIPPVEVPPVQIVGAVLSAENSMQYSNFSLKNNTSAAVNFVRVMRYHFAFSGDSILPAVIRYPSTLGGGAVNGLKETLGVYVLTNPVHFGSGTVCCEVWNVGETSKWDENCLSFTYPNA
jgi:hypothetical protein